MQHLAGREGDFAHNDHHWSGPGSGSGPDPDSNPNPKANKPAVRNKKKHSRFARKGEKAKGTVHFVFVLLEKVTNSPISKSKSTP